MDGVHDLGGREGFGPVPFKDDSTPFHSEWEKRAYGMAQSSGGGADWTLDWFRFCRELIPPADYLSRSYFDHWLSTLSAQLIDAGYVTLEEISTGVCGFKPDPGYAPASAEEARAFVRNPASYAMAEDDPPQFSVGDTVRAAALGSPGHTRLPLYVRGRTGSVHAHHGCHVLPDASARGLRKASHLYTVRFAAAELWPEAQGRRSQVFVDLWEDYLERA